MAGSTSTCRRHVQRPGVRDAICPRDKTVSNLYGPLRVGYIKPQGKNASFEIGALLTLMGAEYTFTFETINTERGLFWNQENAINRRIQVNQTIGKRTASLSGTKAFTRTAVNLQHIEEQ